MDAKDREVLRAAHLLRSYCEGNRMCKGCPLLDGCCCYVDSPRSWELPEIEEEERRE